MIRKTIYPETQVLDDRKGIVEYTASDETLDQDGEVLRVSGWRFTHFKKNAPFVDSHNYESIEKLLGKVVDFTVVAGKRLVETVQWAKDVPESRLAQIGWKMTAAGFLKAVSVGFKPVRMLRAGDQGWAAELARLKLDASANVKRIFLEMEQFELSAVIMGANTNALLNMAKAYKAGALDDADLDVFVAKEDQRLRRNRWMEQKQRERTQEGFLKALNATAQHSFMAAFERALRRV